MNKDFIKLIDIECFKNINGLTLQIIPISIPYKYQIVFTGYPSRCFYAPCRSEEIKKINEFSFEDAKELTKHIKENLFPKAKIIENPLCNNGKPLILEDGENIWHQRYNCIYEIKYD